MWHIPFNTEEYIDFGGVMWSLLLWKFGLGSYARSKIHWPLAPWSAVKWIKTSRGVESSDNRAHRRIILRFYAVQCFDSHGFKEPRNAAPKTNGSLICHNFQDQTSTATVITPPKSMYSTGLNAICHMSGNFYEGRSAKFRYVYYTIAQSAQLTGSVNSWLRWLNWEIK